MHRGYIKLWRKTLDNGLSKNMKLLGFWSWCLMQATHKEIEKKIGFQTVNLAPGQFIFSYRSASELTGLSVRELRTCVETLKNDTQIEVNATHKFSIITIINWVAYQPEESTNDTLNAKKRHTGDTLATHSIYNKNVKNIRNNNTPPNPPNENAVEKPEWLNLELWAEFKAERKEMKAPLTDRAEKMAITELFKLKEAGEDIDAVIRQSVVNRWKGLFPVKNGQNQVIKKQSKTPEWL